MAPSPPSDPFSDTARIRLSESEWQDLRALVHDAVGIKLSEAKRIFLASRLMKRLRANGIRSFREYFSFVARSGSASAEHQQFVNAVTTNKTEFFREASHFGVMTQWLNDPSPRIQNAKSRGLRIWCAAASTGEEPYTIAAVLQAHLPHREWSQARIVASDIDTGVLETARRGVYPQASVADVDPLWRARMFLQGTNQYRGKYRVRRDLREHVSFVQQNLVARDWQVGGPFDAVFCRNVLIYFDRPTQQDVVRRLFEHVEPHGLLFLGAAESLSGLRVSVQPVAHAAYAKRGSDLPKRFRSAIPITAGRVERRTTPSPPRGCQSWSRLRLGEVRAPDSGWLCAQMHESILFALYDETRCQSVVGHIAFESARSVRDALTEGTARWNSLHGTPNCRTSLLAKVVVSSSKDNSDFSSDVEAPWALAGWDVQIQAMRYYGSRVHAWIEPGPMRVLVRAASPLSQRVSLGQTMCIEQANSGNP